MFEIPDDDDERFWNDIASLSPISVKSEKENRPLLRVPGGSCVVNTVKSLGSESRLNPEVPSSLSSPSTDSARKGSTLGRDSGNTPVRASGVSAYDTANRRNLVNSLEGQTDISTVQGGQAGHAREQSGQAGHAREQNGQAGHAREQSGQAKRKRKFPGPAGMLPHLGTGQGLDMLTSTSTAQLTHPKPQEEMIPASQSSEDFFSDVPWRTLMSDLGEDGTALMKRFSIANVLHNAGKKQLNNGKALFILGGIDSLESHGSEASVTIKDRSGKMQGTIHRDLLKEYEPELQPGTVLVLKQVSIISVSQRNHYLNITPTNMVALYHNRGDTLKSLKFHGSQDSLRSVLVALEGAASSRRHSLDASLTLTPSRHSGVTNLSVQGSAVGTPVMRNHRMSRSPNLFSPSPNISNTSFDTSSSSHSPRLSSPSCHGRLGSSSVREVGVINSNNHGNIMAGAAGSTVVKNIYNSCNNRSYDRNYTDLRSGVTSGMPTTPHAAFRNFNTSQQTVTAVPVPGNGAVAMETNGTQHNVGSTRSPSLTQTFGLAGESTNTPAVSHKTIADCTTPITSAVSNNTSPKTFDSPNISSAKWKFKSPSLNKKQSPPSVSNSPQLPSSVGVSQCQQVSSKLPAGQMSSQQASAAPSTHVAMATDAVGCQYKAGQMRGNSGPVNNVQGTTDGDLWEDDLSDELLSQLSEEMT